MINDGLSINLSVPSLSAILKMQDRHELKNRCTLAIHHLQDLAGYLKLLNIRISQLEENHESA